MRIVLGSRCNTEVVAVGPGNRFAQMITDDEFGLRLLQSDQSFTGGLILAFVPSTLIVYIHAGQTGAQIPLPSPESWNASERNISQVEIMTIWREPSKCRWLGPS